jgi:hypothetical protein
MFLSQPRRKLCKRYYDKRSTTCVTKLKMVRNIDLPEAIVFYGVESMMKHISGDDDNSLILRPGVVRLLNECREVGTAALLLSEELLDDETKMRQRFQKAWDSSSDATASSDLHKIIGDDDQVLHFRCLGSQFVCATINNSHDESSNDQSDDFDESIEFYNLQSMGMSPSPAFVLDSLRSVHIDPRGFGGSSGFGRGQWVEPRRSPLPARTVVFISGDWVSNNFNDKSDKVKKPTVKDRCAASRAAGCRVIYLEQVLDQSLSISIEDDTVAMSLCDGITYSFGNDNMRDIQPISLDAISTPGDYWLNPPTPRDDKGNAVAVDQLVEYFRSERDLEKSLEDSGCVIVENDDFDNDDDDEDDMSEDEMASILADLDVF